MSARMSFPVGQVGYHEVGGLVDLSGSRLPSKIIYSVGIKKSAGSVTW